MTVGAYVELLATDASADGRSIPAGTRGVVRARRSAGGSEELLVALLASERPTGETLWLPAEQLTPA